MLRACANAEHFADERMPAVVARTKDTAGRRIERTALAQLDRVLCSSQRGPLAAGRTLAESSFAAATAPSPTPTPTAARRRAARCRVVDEQARRREQALQADEQLHTRAADRLLDAEQAIERQRRLHNFRHVESEVALQRATRASVTGAARSFAQDTAGNGSERSEEI